VKILQESNGHVTAIVRVDPAEKALVIGKGGRNVGIVRKMARRHFKIDRVLIE
jgi:N utilization substance protein A